MANLGDYRCTECGLYGVVSGGVDSLMAGSTETKYCANCEKLMDLMTFLWEGGDVEPKCYKCNTHCSLSWVRDDPCPRCNGRMRRGDLIVHAD